MGQEDTLVDRVRALGEAVVAEEAHIDTIIDALKQPHDSPVVAEAIAQLEAIRTRVSGFHADPPPPDNPAPPEAETET